MSKFPLKTFILIFSVLPHFIFSQGINVDLASEVGFAPKNVSRAISGAMGSPYIEESYQSVKIKNFEDKIYSGRYNAFISEMEILLGAGQTPIALDIANNDYEVIFLNENKIYKSFAYTTDRGVSKKGFLVIVSDENNVQLLKEERIKYYDKIPATSSYDQDKPAKFRREDDTYYIKLKDDSILYLPSRTKDIPSVFPNNEKEISTFIKKNKIKTKNEEDIIKLVNFIGSL
ncbi:hypothetical protein [Paucihalobacter sp.]|uniref:hypothetical protein n=1 Tax=Paucihalobacter sp. TaxID=2850405 RepID=UPI002FE26E69